MINTLKSLFIGAVSLLILSAISFAALIAVPLLIFLTIVYVAKMYYEEEDASRGQSKD